MRTTTIKKVSEIVKSKEKKKKTNIRDVMRWKKAESRPAMQSNERHQPGIYNRWMVANHDGIDVLYDEYWM